MNRSQKIAVGLIGYLLAQAILVLGIALLLQEIGASLGIEVGLMFLAAASLLVMWQVIDMLVPDAGDGFVSTLKLISAAVFFIASSLMFLSVITGRYHLLAPA